MCIEVDRILGKKSSIRFQEMNSISLAVQFGAILVGPPL